MDIPCICPPLRGAVQHPDGDTVTLLERLPFRSAIAIRNDFIILKSASYVSPGEALAALSEGYLYHGIVSWTLCDEKGKALPVSREAIHDALLPHTEEALAVSDAADTLYGETVVLPLLVRVSKLLPPTPTDDSTSATTDSPAAPPTQSSPSSTTTSPTDGTETILAPLVGVSS